MFAKIGVKKIKTGVFLLKMQKIKTYSCRQMQNEELYVFIFGIFNKKMAILIFFTPPIYSLYSIT